jgi:D-alanyl-D-alanine carboxypeptidase
VTLAQLLSHTSGMPDFDEAYAAESPDMASLLKVVSRPRTNPELVAKALTQKWQFTPGTKFAYSNTNYVVVGMMLEKATGQQLAQLLAKRVFAPAGMTHTTYASTPAWPARHLTEYAIADKPYALNTLPAQLLRPRRRRGHDRQGPERVLPFAGHRQAPQAGHGAHHGQAAGGGQHVRAGPPGGRGSVPRAGREAGRGAGPHRASLGTMSYAFTSPDGTRQVVLAYNGRDYTKDSTTFNDFLIAALQATCPTKAAPAPAKPAKPANPPSSAPPSTGLGDRAFPAPDVVGWRP